MTPLDVVETPTIRVCSECGSIGKSGTRSCCGRGGSWFGSCGSAGDTKLDHTWYEGIRVCNEKQFQAVASQQRYVSQAKANTSSDDSSARMVSKAVIVPEYIFISMSAHKSKPLTVVSSLTLPVNTIVANDTKTTASKLIDMTTTASIHTSLGMLAPKPIDTVTNIVSTNSALTGIHTMLSQTSSADSLIMLCLVTQTITILVNFIDTELSTPTLDRSRALHCGGC